MNYLSINFKILSIIDKIPIFMLIIILISILIVVIGSIILITDYLSVWSKRHYKNGWNNPTKSKESSTLQGT